MNGRLLVEFGPQLVNVFVGLTGVEAFVERKKNIFEYCAMCLRIQRTNLFIFWLTGTRNMAKFDGLLGR